MRRTIGAFPPLSFMPPPTLNLVLNVSAEPPVTDKQIEIGLAWRCPDKSVDRSSVLDSDRTSTTVTMQTAQGDLQSRRVDVVRAVRNLATDHGKEGLNDSSASTSHQRDCLGVVD